MLSTIHINVIGCPHQKTIYKIINIPPSSYRAYQGPCLLAGGQKIEHPSHFLLSPSQYFHQMLPSVPRTQNKLHREEVEATLPNGVALVSWYAEPLIGSVQARMLS